MRNRVRVRNDLYRKIIESHIDSYNRLDTAGMLLNADPEIIFENVSNGKVTLRTNGIDELKKYTEESKGYFIERRQDNRDNGYQLRGRSTSRRSAASDTCCCLNESTSFSVNTNAGMAIMIMKSPIST